MSITQYDPDRLAVEDLLIAFNNAVMLCQCDSDGIKAALIELLALHFKPTMAPDDVRLAVEQLTPQLEEYFSAF